MLACAITASAQVKLHGRVYGEFTPGSTEVMPLTTVPCFASLEGSTSEPMQFATWSIDPVAWYSLVGTPGRYAMYFGEPAHYMRPIILTNIFTKDGEDLYRVVGPKEDYAVWFDRKWDEKPAQGYYQTFISKGTSVTNVGFRLVFDGVDGMGPGTQNFLVSIHKKAEGTPDKWPQVGPTMLVRDVDDGGMKDYYWSAGWNSGEVPITPGQTYAVYLRPEKSGATFQGLWWPNNDDKTSDCYRVGANNTGWQGTKLNMIVSTDSDGLVIPFNKRVTKRFTEFAGFSTKWTQTYVAQGRSLAFAAMYAAVATAQQPLSRQRVRVTVRKGGINGPIVGIQKVGIGQGNYTGDSSWGLFGTVYQPGEVPLEPGKIYAIEFECMETYHTTIGYINIKNVASDGKTGFNPYKKAVPDEYPNGTSYKNGTDKQKFDIDMQVVEYANEAPNWDKAQDEKNLIANGDMSLGLGIMHPGSDSSKLPRAFWNGFTIGKNTQLQSLEDDAVKGNEIIRVTGIPEGDNIIDGGYVQKVEGLDHIQSYRLAGKVRCTRVLDYDNQCKVGYDPTGQTDNPDAATIVWTTIPSIQGFWVPYATDPIRPDKGSTAISVWVRGKSKSPNLFQFKADFDDFTLNRVKMEIPGK